MAVKESQFNHITGWYHLRRQDRDLVMWFTDGLTASGYRARDYEGNGFSFEKVVVMTPEEYEQSVAETMKGVNYDRDVLAEIDDLKSRVQGIESAHRRYGGVGNAGLGR